MLGLSIWKIAIIGGIVMLVFGRGKISETMGDVAKGIKSFKRGMADDADNQKVLEQTPPQTAAAPIREKAQG